MIRTEIINEIKEWLEDNDYDLTVDDIKAEYEYQNLDLTAAEIDEIEDLISDHDFEEELKAIEREAEEERACREWEKQIRYQEAEYRAMVWVA